MGGVEIPDIRQTRPSSRGGITTNSTKMATNTDFMTTAREQIANYNLKKKETQSSNHKTLIRVQSVNLLNSRNKQAATQQNTVVD